MYQQIFGPFFQRCQIYLPALSNLGCAGSLMMNALNYLVLAEASTGRLIATLIAAIVLILVLILKFRVQAFISLLLVT